MRTDTKLPQTSARARTLGLIDLHNLMGARPRATDAGSIAAVSWLVTSSMDLSEHDHLVVAVHPRLAFETAASFPAHRLVCAATAAQRVGTLATWLSPAEVARRYGRLIVASGDGVFTDLVSSCGGSRVLTEVVSLPESMASNLALAAHETYSFRWHEHAAA